MSNCQWEELLMMDQLGELEAALRPDLQTHLSTCKICQTSAGKHAALLAQANQMPVPELSAAAWQRIDYNFWDRLEQRKSATPWNKLLAWLSPSPSFQPSWALAALVAVFFLPPLFGTHTSSKTDLYHANENSQIVAEQILSQLEGLPAYMPTDLNSDEHKHVATHIGKLSQTSIATYLDDYSQTFPVDFSENLDTMSQSEEVRF